MMEDRLKDATEEADKERALKEVAEATVKDKEKVMENVEEQIRAVEKAWTLTEQRVEELEVKLRGMELKLAKVESLNSSIAKEIVELKTALKTNKDKWYNTGFADAKNSVEPIIYQSRWHGFSEGWMAALQVMGVPNDSPLRNPDQIPYPDPTPPVQNPTSAEEEDTSSMRELV